MTEPGDQDVELQRLELLEREVAQLERRVALIEERLAQDAARSAERRSG